MIWDWEQKIDIIIALKVYLIVLNVQKSARACTIPTICPCSHFKADFIKSIASFCYVHAHERKFTIISFVYTSNVDCQPHQNEEYHEWFVWYHHQNLSLSLALDLDEVN